MGLNIQEFIVCPKCKSELSFENSELLLCTGCSEKYKITNNVPDLKTQDMSADFFAKEEAELEYWKEAIPQEMADSGDCENYKVIEEVHSLTFNEDDFKDKVMLDIGAGPLGGMFEKFNSGKCFAVDILADKYAQNFNLSNYKVKYICAEAEHLPFRDNSADFILASNSIDHVANIFQSFVEINRVLKEDGVFVCSSLYNSHPFAETETFVFDDEFIRDELPKFFEVIDSSYKIFDKKLQNCDGLYKAVCKKKDITFENMHLLDQYSLFIRTYCCALKAYMDNSEKSLEYTKIALDNYVKLYKQDEYRYLFLKLKYMILNKDEKVFEELKKIDRNYFDNESWMLVIQHKISEELISNYQSDERILKLLELSMMMSENSDSPKRKGVSFFYLGMYYLKKGLKDKSKEAFENCLAIVPPYWKIAKEAKQYLGVPAL
jgi:ubiquinone/menaquinone biosynthesis C-methylase UbiE/uncharacterized protein YbaR (Trm112 family)